MPEPTRCASTSLPQSSASDVSDLTASSCLPPSRSATVSDASREMLVSSSAPTATGDMPSEAASSFSSAFSSASSSIDFQSPSPQRESSAPRMLTRRSGKASASSLSLNSPSCPASCAPMSLDEKRAPLPKAWRGRGKSRSRSRASAGSPEDYPEQWGDGEDGEERENGEEQKGSGREDKNDYSSEGVPEEERGSDWGNDRREGRLGQKEGAWTEREINEREEGKLPLCSRGHIRGDARGNEEGSEGDEKHHVETGDTEHASEAGGCDDRQRAETRTNREREERKARPEGPSFFPYQDGEAGDPSEFLVSSSPASVPSSFAASDAVHGLSVLEPPPSLTETPTLRTPHTSSSSLSPASSSCGSSSSLSERREDGGGLDIGPACSPNSTTRTRASGDCSAPLCPATPQSSAVGTHEEVEIDDRQDAPSPFSSCFPSCSSLSWSPAGVEDRRGAGDDSEEKTRESSLVSFSPAPGQLRHPRTSTLSDVSSHQPGPSFFSSSSPRLSSSLSSSDASLSSSFVSTTVESRGEGANDDLDKEAAHELATGAFRFSDPVGAFAQTPNDAGSPQSPLSPRGTPDSEADSPAGRTPSHDAQGIRGYPDAARYPPSLPSASSPPLCTLPVVASVPASKQRRTDASEAGEPTEGEAGPRGAAEAPTPLRFSAAPAFLFSPSSSSSGQEKPEETGRLDGSSVKAEETSDCGGQEGNSRGNGRIKREGRHAAALTDPTSECLSGRTDTDRNARDPKRESTGLVSMSPASHLSAALPTSSSSSSSSSLSSSVPSVRLSSEASAPLPGARGVEGFLLQSCASPPVSAPVPGSVSVSVKPSSDRLSGSSPLPQSACDASALRLAGENNFFAFALDVHSPRRQSLASSLAFSAGAVKGALGDSLLLDRLAGEERERVPWDEMLHAARSRLQDPPIPRTEDEWEALIGTSKTADFSVYLGRELLDVSSVQDEAKHRGKEAEKDEEGGLARPPRVQPWESVILVLDPKTAALASPYSATASEAERRDLPIVLLEGAGDPAAAPFVVIEETFLDQDGSFADSPASCQSARGCGEARGYAEGASNACGPRGETGQVQAKDAERGDGEGQPRAPGTSSALGREDKSERQTVAEKGGATANDHVERKAERRVLERSASAKTRRQLGRLVLEAASSGVGRRALEETGEAARNETCMQDAAGSHGSGDLGATRRKASAEEREGAERVSARESGEKTDEREARDETAAAADPYPMLPPRSDTEPTPASLPATLPSSSCSSPSSSSSSFSDLSSSATSQARDSSSRASGGLSLSGRAPSFAAFRESLQRAVACASSAEVDPRLLSLLRLADAMEEPQGGKGEETGENGEGRGDIPGDRVEKAEETGSGNPVHVPRGAPLSLPHDSSHAGSLEPEGVVSVDTQGSDEKPSVRLGTSAASSSVSSLFFSPLYPHAAPTLSAALAASPAASFSSILFAGAPVSPCDLSMVEAARRVQEEEKRREKRERRFLQELLRGFGGKTSDLHVPIPLCLFPPPARRISHLGAVQMWNELRHSHAAAATSSANPTREGTRSSRAGDRRSLLSAGDCHLSSDARDLPGVAASSLVPTPQALAAQSRTRGTSCGHSGGAPVGDSGVFSRGEMNFSPSSSAPSSSPLSASSDRKKALPAAASLASSPFLQGVPTAPDDKGAASPAERLLGSSPSGVCTSTAEARREIGELSLALIRRSPDILLLPIQQQELALQQQLHQLMLCRHWWAEEMDRSLYRPPVVSEEDKNAKIIDAPPLSAPPPEGAARSLGAMSPASREKEGRERDRGEEGALGDERRGERSAKRSGAVGAKKPSSDEKKRGRSAREETTHDDSQAFPNVLEPSSLMKEIFGLQKLPGSKAYRKLKDPRSGPPSWGTQVWFSLGRRAELEFLLRRHFYPETCRGERASASAAAPAAGTPCKKRGKEVPAGAACTRTGSPGEAKPIGQSAVAREKVLKEKRRGRAGGLSRGRDEDEEPLEEDGEDQAPDGSEATAPGAGALPAEEGSDKGSKSSTEKEEGDEDCLLHPLLLLRIANCEWRILRDAVPDVVKIFKQHVRCFKLKRNPYVTTLQQQVDYKLAVMASLRSPFYRVASPFVDHAIRLILRHRFGALSLSFVSPSPLELDEAGAERAGFPAVARPDEEELAPSRGLPTSRLLSDEQEKREGAEDDDLRRKGRQSGYALPFFGRDSVGKVAPAALFTSLAPAVAAPSGLLHAPLPAARLGEEERVDEQLGKGCRKKVKRRRLHEDDDASLAPSPFPSPEPPERESALGSFPFASLGDDEGRAAGIEEAESPILPPECAHLVRIIQHGEDAGDIVEAQEDEGLHALLALFPSLSHAVRVFARFFAACRRLSLRGAAQRADVGDGGERLSNLAREVQMDEPLFKAVVTHPWTAWLSWFFWAKTKNPGIPCLPSSLPADIGRPSPLPLSPPPLPPASPPSLSSWSSSAAACLPAVCVSSSAGREEASDPLVLPRRAFAHFGNFQEFPRFVCGGLDRLKCIRRRRFRVEVRKGTGCLANSFSFSFSSLSSPSRADGQRDGEARDGKESACSLRKAAAQSGGAENPRGEDTPESPGPTGASGAAPATQGAGKKKKSRKGGKKGDGKKDERRDEETAGGDGVGSNQEKDAALEEEWGAWSLERVGVGGKYYRMIEVEEIPDEELAQTILLPFHSSFREDVCGAGEGEDANAPDDPEKTPDGKAAQVKRETLEVAGGLPVSVSPAPLGTGSPRSKGVAEEESEPKAKGEMTTPDDEGAVAKRKAFLRTEALLRLFEYRQSVPEKLEPGLAVQFASSLIPGSHVAWWEGVIISVKEDEGSGSAPTGPPGPSPPSALASLPLKPSAFPSCSVDKKKRRRPSPAFLSLPSSSSVGSQSEATSASCSAAGERDLDGESGRRGRERRDKAGEAKSPDSEAAEDRDEDKVRAEEEDEAGGWVEIAYQVGPRTVKRAFTSLRLFMPQNVPLAEPAEGCWRLRPRSPFFSAPPPSLAHFLRLLHLQEKAQDAETFPPSPSASSAASDSASEDPWEGALMAEGAGDEGAVRHRYRVSLLAHDVWPGAVVCVRMEENPHELHDALVLNVRTAPCCCPARHRQQGCAFSDDEDLALDEDEARDAQDAKDGHAHTGEAERMHNSAGDAPEEREAEAQGEAAKDEARLAEKKADNTQLIEASAKEGAKVGGSQEETAALRGGDGPHPAGARAAGAGTPKNGGARADEHLRGRCTCSWRPGPGATDEAGNAFTVCATGHTPPSYFSSLLPSSSARGEAAAAHATPQLRCALEGRRQFLATSSFPSSSFSSSPPVRVVAVKLLYFADAAVEWISVDVLRYRLCYDVHPQDPSVPLALLRPRWVWVIPRFVAPLPPQLHHLQDLLAALTNGPASGTVSFASPGGEALGGGKAPGDREEGLASTIHTVFSRYLRVAPGTASCAKASLWYIPADLQLHPACMPPFVHVPAGAFPSNAKRREKPERSEQATPARETGEGAAVGRGETDGSVDGWGETAKIEKARERRKTGNADEAEAAEKGRLHDEGTKLRKTADDREAAARATEENTENDGKQDPKQEGKSVHEETPTAVSALAVAPPQPTAAASLAEGAPARASSASPAKRDSQAPQADEKEATSILFAPTICKFLQPDLDPRALLLQNLWIYRYPSMPYFPPHTAPAIGAMLASAQASVASNRHAFVRRAPLFASRDGGGAESDRAHAPERAGDAAAVCAFAPPHGEAGLGEDVKSDKEPAWGEKEDSRAGSDTGGDPTGLADAQAASAGAASEAPVSSTTAVAGRSLESGARRQSPPGEREVGEGGESEDGVEKASAGEAASLHARAEPVTAEEEPAEALERDRAGADNVQGLATPHSRLVAQVAREGASRQGVGGEEEERNEAALGTLAHHPSKEKREERVDPVSLSWRRSGSSPSPVSDGLDSAAAGSREDRRRRGRKNSVDASGDTERLEGDPDETPETKGREKRERDEESGQTGNPSSRWSSRRKGAMGRAAPPPAEDVGCPAEDRAPQEERSQDEGSKVRAREESEGGVLGDDETLPDREKGEECRRSTKTKLVAVSCPVTAASCAVPAAGLERDKGSETVEREDDAAAPASATCKNKRGAKRTRRMCDGGRESRDVEKEMSGGERERKKGKKQAAITLHVSKSQKDGSERTELSAGLSFPAALLSTNEDASSPASSSSSSSSFIEVIEVESVSTPDSESRVILQEDDRARSLSKEGRSRADGASLTPAAAYVEVGLPRDPSQSSQTQALAPPSSPLSPSSLSASPSPSLSASPPASACSQGGARPSRGGVTRQGESPSVSTRGSLLSAPASGPAAAAALASAESERGGRRAEGDWERGRRQNVADPEKDESSAAATQTREGESEEGRERRGRDRSEGDSGARHGASLSPGPWGVELASSGPVRGRRGDRERGFERRDDELDDDGEGHNVLGKSQPLLEWSQLTWATEDEVEEESKRDTKRDGKGTKKKKVKVTGAPASSRAAVASEGHPMPLGPGVSASREGLKKGKSVLDKLPEQPGLAQEAAAGGIAGAACSALRGSHREGGDREGPQK
nr:TPA: hypothetical protein BN1204_049430 [Neospora caninum Liverpool]